MAPVRPSQKAVRWWTGYRTGWSVLGASSALQDDHVFAVDLEAGPTCGATLVAVVGNLTIAAVTASSAPLDVFALCYISRAVNDSLPVLDVFNPLSLWGPDVLFHYGDHLQQSVDGFWRDLVRVPINIRAKRRIRPHQPDYTTADSIFFSIGCASSLAQSVGYGLQVRCLWQK